MGMVKKSINIMPDMFMCLGWNQLTYEQKQILTKVLLSVYKGQAQIETNSI